ncbi:MAG: hypothetical protein CSA09_05160 [Candidatus Contendobacter odensis]|uniref:Type II secretion system protein GspC N-terminal domain-containing protein n=1 Tax=Candidatus Contendibacter odensensis TaxID=1400860 RepID=A0A2G6PE17_9GAMM|nr:MAG: hypothetical protein CSA09_05160 [Candidatus Contendobacter odensis]
MAIRTFWILFWLVVAIVATVVLIAQLWFPPQLPAIGQVAPPATEAILPLQPFRLPAEAHYQQVVTRPLFIADRRPEQAVKIEEPPPPPVEVEQKFDLIGVVIIAGRATALLRTRAPGSRVLRVRQGETTEGGWQLRSVVGNKVVLDKAGKTQEVDLVRPLAVPPRVDKPKVDKASHGKTDRSRKTGQMRNWARARVQRAARMNNESRPQNSFE